MISLRKITENNFIDAFDLKLGEGQDAFVSHPIRSLAQAYVYRNQCQPFGIYNDDEMVGYVMVIYDYDIPEYDIWHMMIDERHQGEGFGKAALEKVLSYIGTKPFGDSNRVTLTCNKDNEVALGLYHGMEFRETGAADDDEIELSMTITNESEDKKLKLVEVNCTNCISTHNVVY
jgi:diamine N-acetyltransferase